MADLVLHHGGSSAYTGMTKILSDAQVLELREQLRFVRLYRGCAVEHTARCALAQMLNEWLGLEPDRAEELVQRWAPE